MTHTDATLTHCARLYRTRRRVEAWSPGMFCARIAASHQTVLSDPEAAAADQDRCGQRHDEQASGELIQVH